MARKGISYPGLIKMARQYGVDKNALFMSAADTYLTQKKVIDAIKEEIERADMTVEKTYLAGNSNIYASPMVKELPKHVDSANRSLSLMMDIIVKLGVENSPKKSKFDQFLDGELDDGFG